MVESILNPTSHLGNTQGSALGKLASILVQKLFPRFPGFYYDIDLKPFRADRFSEDIERVSRAPKLLKFWRGSNLGNTT